MYVCMCFVCMYVYVYVYVYVLSVVTVFFGVQFNDQSILSVMIRIMGGCQFITKPRRAFEIYVPLQSKSTINC